MLFVFAALYRFNTLGGAMAGFDNDHFVHYAYARQVAAGEQPIRDFLSVGLKGVPPSLTFEASALAQRWFGDNLRSEAVLTVGAIAVAAVLTFLAAAAVGPAPLAALFTWLSVLIAPKLYNYPKVLVLAAACLLVVRYAQRPSIARAAALGALVAAAFLFRHDYAVYAGVAALAVMLAGAGSWRRGAGHLAACGAVTLALLAPSLVHVQRSVGLVPYFQDGFRISGREMQHTDLEWPALTRTNAAGRRVATEDLLGVEENAEAWLYYVHLALPWLALLAVWQTRRRPDPAARRVTLIALAVAAIVAMPLLLRGNLAARFGDIGPIAAVLLTGATALAMQEWPGERLAARLLRVSATLLLVAMTIVAVWTIGDVTRELDTSGWSESPRKLSGQAVRRWTDLAALPEAYWTRPPESGSIRAAQYLNRCTRPSDRVLVMTYAPEVVGLSGRLFAAGLSRVSPEEFAADDHQRLSVERWSRQSVPIVLTEDAGIYDRSYPSEFRLLDEYLQSHYEPAGRIEIDGGVVLRVMARREAVATGTFGDTGLPCFR
ncbi:MAG: hypothetical protein ACRD26_15875 [Vicinamibacterales bacterium]